MRGAYRAGGSARDVMTANAETANALINDLNTRVQQLPPGDQRFEQFQAITAAKEAFLAGPLRSAWLHRRPPTPKPSKRLPPNLTPPSPA